MENLKQDERLACSLGLTVATYTFSLWLIQGPQNLSVMFPSRLCWCSLPSAEPDWDLGYKLD